jgi:CAAX protease family protein
VSVTAKPWGRFTTLVLGAFALLAGQAAALMALSAWLDRAPSALTDFSGDGTAITLVIVASTPVEIALLVLFARQTGESATQYLGLIWPRRSEVVFGVVAIVALMFAGDVLSWLLGRGLVTSFQTDIYRSARAAGWLLWLWLAIVVITPIGEEILFRGFLFRGWLRSPQDAWPVIVLTGAVWAIIHLQYDWYVISQVFAFGLALGWMRWATGSAILTMLLHGLINSEGMLETFFNVNWLEP